MPDLKEALTTAGIAPLPAELFANVDPTPFVDAAFKIEADITNNKDCKNPEVKYVHPGVAGMLDLFCEQVNSQITENAHIDLLATVHLYIACREKDKAKKLPRLPDAAFITRHAGDIEYMFDEVSQASVVLCRLR